MSAESRSAIENVELFWSPWVSGTRSVTYLGPISSELFLESGLDHDRSGAWSKAERELLESIRDRARAVGANAVVGIEVTVDPFARSDAGVKGIRCSAAGTAVRIAPRR